MVIELSALHWIYVLFVVLIIGFMVMRKDTTLVCVAGIFAIAAVACGSISSSLSAAFNSFIYAIMELLPTILIISIIVSLSRTMTDTGISDMMISPFAKLIRTPTLAYWVTGLVMLAISLVFWPSPGIALVGAVMLPVAIKAGLPAIGVAAAMNLFGHGIALSGDFVIQGAPKLTADAAGIPVGDVVNASIPLVIVMGVVTTVVAFAFLLRDMKKGVVKVPETPVADVVTSNTVHNASDAEHISSGTVHNTDDSRESSLLPIVPRRIFAILIPILYVIDVVIMSIMDLTGGEATALIGGTTLLIMLVVTMAAYGSKGLEKTTNYLIEGFTFGFRVFGPVIPIAAFFYLGDSGFKTIVGDYLPATSNGIVNDLGAALASVVRLNKGVGAFTLTGVGAITGLDGSGFSGISLVGSVAAIFSKAIGYGVETLTALGQIAAIWVGGGTLIPWALIPAAAICNVDPFELSRRNLIPVVAGLLVTTIVAIFLI